MNKRTRVGLLPTPIFAGMGLSAQAKNQLFLAFIPIASAALVLSLSKAGISISLAVIPGYNLAQVNHSVKEYVNDKPIRTGLKVFGCY